MKKCSLETTNCYAYAIKADKNTTHTHPTKQEASETYMLSSLKYICVLESSFVFILKLCGLFKTCEEK